MRSAILMPKGIPIAQASGTLLANAETTVSQAKNGSAQKI